MSDHSALITAAGLCAGGFGSLLSAFIALVHFERRIADLEEVKKKFEALVDWMQDVLIYVAFLEGHVPIGKRNGRHMPPLPAILRPHLERRDRYEFRSSEEVS